MQQAYRKTSQHLLASQKQARLSTEYDIYPTVKLASGKLSQGIEALAEQLKTQKQIILDGYIGVYWQAIREALEEQFQAAGLRVSWQDISSTYYSEEDILSNIKPFLGGDDPLFGKRYTGELKDFINPKKLELIKPNEEAELNIIYGCGAALANWQDAYHVYLDLPKNELQFRARALSIRNLAMREASDPKKMYKQFYFVDWVVLNKHKAALLSKLDLYVDTQNANLPSFIKAKDLRSTLKQMSETAFRVRPWFEPGVWGGDWIKEKIPSLAQDVPNYAWSFELITPENGLLLESDQKLLECSFDLLMYQNYEEVLGASAERFGYEFPIRFNFLDTFAGGNLSVQVHPQPDFIHEQFGESFTQDETYYILDAKEDATVYLGFKEGVTPEAFQVALEHSANTATALDIEQFVHKLSSKKHDLFLIPNGTLHSSGINNLVLEISATPYIFTFKLYDWMRLGLDGKPRPLNIKRGMQNLYFERQGKRVLDEHISKPVLLESGDDWQLIHLPTHKEHFYDVHRLDFATSVEVTTNHSVHVLSLVEGESLRLETQSGYSQSFSYAETFVVPAAAQNYKLINQSSEPIKVIKAFMKS